MWNNSCEEVKLSSEKKILYIYIYIQQGLIMISLFSLMKINVHWAYLLEKHTTVLILIMLYV